MKTIVSVTPLSIITDSRTYKIAASFSRLGYRSLVLEGLPSNIDPSSLPFELQSLGTHAQKQTDHTLIKYIRNYGTWVARALPPASLYYLHAPYQFPGMYAAARRHHVPIIYDAHDFYPIVDRTLFLGWIESWCIRHAESVVTVSSGIASLLSDQYECQPVVIKNAHDSRLDKKPAEGLRALLGLDEKQFLIACVGQAKSGQRITGALAALAMLPSSVHLAFIGKNTDQYRELASQYGIEHRVHLIPPVMPEEVVPFIQSADAALILYIGESLNYEYCLPNGLFQSIAATLPLLYPGLTEIKKLVDHFELGMLIDPLSAESIKTAVSALLENPIRLSAYRTSVAAAAHALSWEKEEIILKNLISNTLATHDTGN